MSNTRNTGYLTNIIQYTPSGNISFVSGSTTLMSISSSGAITTTGVISGSNAATASSVANLNQNVQITGSLGVTSTITAQTLNVQTVTSSIVYSSGSNIFGNSLSNTQQMTGSLQVTGSNSSYFLGGNVGIGTSSPLGSNTEKTLHLSDGGAGFTTLYVTNGANTLRGIFAVANTNGTVSIGTQTNTDFRIVTNDTTRLTITSGSGVVNISQYTQIGQGINNTQYNILSENQLYRMGGGTLYINNSGAGDVSIAGGGGKVGIATSSPASPLDVFVTRSSGGQVVALTLSDGVTGAQTSGGYKAIRSSSNNGSSRSEIRFLEDGGTNNDTAVAIATQVNASSLTENFRVSRFGYVTTPNQPFFQAYNSAGSSFTSGQTITWGATLNNVGSGYSTSTGRFTAPVAGVYLFRADYRAPSVGSNILDIKTSTGLMTRHEENASYGNPYHQTLAALYKLAAGDYVYCECGAGTQSPDSNSLDRFEGYLLG